MNSLQGKKYFRGATDAAVKTLLTPVLSWCMAVLLISPVEQGLETEMRLKTRSKIKAKKDRGKERLMEEGVFRKKLKIYFYKFF